MSKAKSPRVFVPLTKVDEEQRLVYGTITQEILDKSGEAMDYEMSKPNFEKWSNDIHVASGGLSKGNVRVMHGLNVAGKLTELEFNDNDQSIEVCSKIVDDNEWNKVLEGCYTGFSVGGKYGKRWNETVDGTVIKKYEAIPNEVSLVDNPCCPSATFSLVKADGAEVAVAFAVENDDDAWPAFSKAEAVADKEAEASEEEASTDKKKKAKKEAPKEVEKAVGGIEPTAAQIADKAGELAKTADDGTTWQDHIEDAREELLKASPTQLAFEQSREGKESEGDKEEAEAVETDEGAENEKAGSEADDSVEKVTPPGVKQVWTASDGKTFEKKADAEAHEVSLHKAEPTEAEKLKDRMQKALNNEVAEEASLMEDFDRLSSVVAAISTPFDEEGQPRLEKGMYTINRFSSVLSDMASLSRSIKAEGKREGDDATDSTVSADIIAAVTTLGQSFLTYATNQVTELLAGMDDEVVVSYHDYYYNAAQVDPKDGLAKDVCSLIGEHREPAEERRDELVKAFGIVEDEPTDELTPGLKKRFDQLEAERDDLKKVAEEAVGKVEELAKRMQAIEDTPLPRAPRNTPVDKGAEDGTFFGKAAVTQEEKTAVLHDMIKTHGPDDLALMMIKASHQNGGQQLALKSQ